MNKRIIYLSIALTILAACNNKEENPLVAEKLTSTVSIEDESLASPMRLSATNDMLAIINFDDVADTLVSLFDKNGNHITNFLPKGEGPLEALRINRLQYCENNNSFFAADCYTNKLFTITWDGENCIVKPSFSFESRSPLDRDVDGGVSYTGDFVILANNKMLVTNGTTSGMFAILDKDGHLEKCIVDYPDKNNVSDQLSDYANIHLYRNPSFGISPDGNFAAAFYSLADMRVLMNVENDSVNYSMCLDKYPNDIFVADCGNNIVRGACTNTSYAYTRGLTLSNDFAYELHMGITRGDFNKIDKFNEIKKQVANMVRVYDKEGNLKRLLELDQWVITIGVTPDDTLLYALSESAEDGFTILKYEL